MIIRKLGVRSLAKVVSSIYAVFGLIAGAVFTIVAVAGAVPAEGLDAMGKVVFSPLAILWLPIAFGIKGYLVGAVAAWVFNQAAALSGGLEMDVEPGGELAA